MFVANYLIGLREGLEAALIVGIVVAFLTKAGRRDLLGRMWLGIGAVIVAALALGFILTFGPYGLSFAAQEIIGGTLSIVAVGLVTWMVFWMAATARHLKHDLENRLEQALEGSGWGVAAIAVVAVAREGLETTLFVWSTIHPSSGMLSALLGVILGILTAVVLGWLIYRGMVHINLSKFFLWTGVFLIVVAAGVLAYGIGDLQEAGVLPGVMNHAYDLGGLLPSTGVIGSLLFGMFNYTPAPTWLQFIAWWAYLAITLPLFLRHYRSTPQHDTTAKETQQPCATPSSR